MSSIIIVAGEQHEKLAKFFRDRGTIDFITSYRNLQDNESVLPMGTYETDKLVYIESEGMSISKDMVALVRALTSSSSFFSLSELFIYVKKDTETDKMLGSVQRELNEEARKRDTFKLPVINIVHIDIMPTYENIYTNVLGAIAVDAKKITIKTVYRVEKNAVELDLYDKGDYKSLVSLNIDTRAMSDYAKLQDLAIKSDDGEVIEDKVTSATIEGVDLNIELVSYLNSTTSKYLYFIGDRRVGTSTLLLLMTLSLIKVGKSVTIVDLAQNPSIWKMLNLQGVPVEMVSAKDLFKNNIKASKDYINVVYDVGISNKSLIEWLSANKTDFKTDFILFDIPVELAVHINTLNSKIIHVTEMTSDAVYKVKPLTNSDVLLLTDIFKVSRRSDEQEINMCLPDNIAKVIAPFMVDFQNVDLKFMEEVLKEVEN